MNQIQSSKPLTLPSGEREGVRGGHWKLVFGIYLACLREAASAKAEICNLEFGI